MPTTVHISLCRSIVSVTHSRPDHSVKRGKRVPASTADIVHAAILWSEQPEMLKKVLLQLPDVTGFVQTPKK
jgi:hypothetical protein